MTLVYRATNRALTELARRHDPDGICGSIDDPHYTVYGAFTESLGRPSVFEDYLTAVGLVITLPQGKSNKPDDAVTFQWNDNAGQLQSFLHAVSTIVDIEYEAYDYDDPKCNALWTAFGLSGDDSSDYFGGYLDSIADAFDLWQDPIHDNAPHELKA